MRSQESGARSPGLWLVLFVVLCSPYRAAAEPFSFDDITFWVGDGASRAAMVVDWVEDSTDLPALVWGYRWDGAATGADMLTAVVASDQRLFAKLGGSSGNPNLVYGLGYDDGDGEFGLDDGTEFDASGIAFDSAPFFAAEATDEDDLYAEGWTFAFWHYGVASGNPYDGGTWIDTEDSIVSRELSDGSWDSWAFENSTTPPFMAFAENPAAAAAPGGLPGDYSGNGVVDAADYAAWRDGLGTIYTEADFDVWREHFGETASVGSAAPSTSPLPPSPLRHAVPEPATAWLLAITFWIAWRSSISQRKEAV